MDKWRRYAGSRKAMHYYAAVREEIERHSPGESILDVGCGGTDIVMAGEFSDRLAINKTPVDNFPAAMIVATWPHVELPRERYDVVTCCQVLEHLEDDELPAFVARLKAVACVLIASVPYRWPRGSCRWHRQDPVDESKLERWLGREDDLRIITDGRLQRMIAIYSPGR